MTDEQAQSQEARTDFFISYAEADLQWAEWIAWHLEKAGSIVYLQAWDLRPGSNVVLELDRALQQELRVLCLLSPDYLTDPTRRNDWAALWQRHQAAPTPLIIPVRIRPCEVAGLLGTLLPLDLLDLDEKQAWNILRAGLEATRAKPGQAPSYPGPAPSFPGALPAIWMVPLRRNRLFTGREAILQRVHQALSQGQRIALTQVITGLGGIGKTQVAIEYAYRYHQQYQTVFWMGADSLQSILSSFLSMAQALQLPERTEQEIEQVITAVQRWYRSHPGWLLIVDNADDLELVHPFLPEGTGRILLTSRNQVTRGIADTTLPLEVMETKEGALLLLRSAKRIGFDDPITVAPEQDHADANTLVTLLGGLPLALDQAGAYIEETQCSIADYLTRYQQQQHLLLQRRGSLATDYPHSIATTWSLSFEQVEQRDAAAADLLRLCAFLASDAIPEEVAVAAMNQAARTASTKKERRGGRLARLFSKPARIAPKEPAPVLDDLVARLRAYSLLRRNPLAHTLSIHRLVQAVLKDQMDKQDRHQWAQRAVRAVNAVFPDVEHQTWPQCDRLLPHALICSELIEQEQMTFPEATRLLNQTGVYLKERARYVEAEPLYQRALAIQEQQLGPTHPHTASSLNNLAGLYSNQGKYSQAEPLFKRALTIREQQLGAQLSFDS